MLLESSKELVPSQINADDIDKGCLQAEIDIGLLPKLARRGIVDLVAQELGRRRSPRIRFAALFEAVGYGHLEIVRFLIDRRVDVDYSVNDYEEMCPLFLAVVTNNLPIATVLLEAGASAYALWEGLLPIHFAVAWGNTPMVKVLQAHGALDADDLPQDINLVSLARAFGRTEMADYLSTMKSFLTEVTNDVDQVDSVIRRIERRVVLHDFDDLGWSNNPECLLPSEVCG